MAHREGERVNHLLLSHRGPVSFVAGRMSKDWTAKVYNLLVSEQRDGGGEVCFCRGGSRVTGS